MTQFPRCALACVLLVAGLWAQNTVSFVYVESFRKGSTRITESNFEVALDTSQPACRIAVKDDIGRDRYLLVCAPQRAATGDDRIVGWQVRLADLRHKMYENVLMPVTDPSQDATQIGWLDPGKFAKIPITRERVIKVDSFYCVVQVKDYHFTTLEQPYLDRINLTVEFTNTRPHSQVRAKEEKTPA